MNAPISLLEAYNPDTSYTISSVRLYALLCRYRQWASTAIRSWESLALIWLRTRLLRSQKHQMYCCSCRVLLDSWLLSGPFSRHWICYRLFTECHCRGQQSSRSFLWIIAPFSFMWFRFLQRCWSRYLFGSWQIQSEIVVFLINLQGIEKIVLLLKPISH